MRSGTCHIRALLFLVRILCLYVLGYGWGFCDSSSAPPVQQRTLRLAAPAHQEQENEAIRLNKVFKATHSRRQADGLIASGRVTVNGGPVESAGLRVVPFRDVVRLDGKIVQGWEALNAPTETVHEYIKYWKPCGITCTTDKSIRSNIITRLRKDGYKPNHRVFPVGRLDKDTCGLILLTSDGRLPNSALRRQYKQPKKYEVLVNYPVTDDEIQQLQDGVVITTQAQRDGKRAPPLTARTQPCLVERIDARTLQMTIVEGRNRQIRKMIEAIGLRVVKLHRFEFMRIGLYPLQGPGDWAPLSKKELDMVFQVIASAAEHSKSVEQ